VETILQISLDHNAWATRELITYCRQLSDEELDRPFEIGPGSIRKTLMHIVAAMRAWASRINGETPPPRSADSPSMDDLLRRCDEAAAALKMAAARVNDEDRLLEIMVFQPAGHPEYRFTRGAALVHVTTHGVHHRGQVFNMLRRLGKPINCDLDPVEWELAATKA
jgi:uncharacterized damage-inducible protein DinB